MIQKRNKRVYIETLGNTKDEQNQKLENVLPR